MMTYPEHNVDKDLKDIPQDQRGGLHLPKGKREKVRFYLPLRFLLIFAWLLSLVCPCLEGKDVVAFERVAVEQGKSYNTVSAILQDHRGFMWFGTPDGLFRYDGIKYVVYRHDSKNNHSISNNNIGGLTLDSQGDLWIGTDNGLNRFDWETETFTHFFHTDDNTSISHSEVQCIFEDKTGVLWIGTFGGGLNQYVRKTQEFKAFMHMDKNPQSLSNNKVRAIFEDSRGNLWIGTHKGVNRFDRKKRLFIRYQADPSIPGSLSHGEVRAFCEDKYGDFWVATYGGGLNKYQKDEDQFVHIPITINGSEVGGSLRIYDICEDSAGFLWIGTRNYGVFRYDQGKKIFRQFTSDPDVPRSLSHNSGLAIFEDDNGILWFGTYGGGVCKFNRRKEKFKHYWKHPKQSMGLINNLVISIYEEPDEIGKYIWVGTLEGLNRIDREKNVFSRYTHDPNDPGSISHNLVLDIYKDRNNILWITTKEGINKLDRHTWKFSATLPKIRTASGETSNRLEKMFEDRLGRFWISSQEGLFKFERSNGTFTRYVHDPENRKSISSNTIMCIRQHTAGTTDALWLGTYNGGLNKFYPGKNEFIQYKANPDVPGSLSNNNVRAVHEDMNGILWLGTDGGLNAFDPHTDKFRSFSIQDGLANDRIFGIMEDDSGCLWLGTSNGLSRFDKKTEVFKTFDILDGQPISYFSQGAFFKSRSGEMAFGGINGLILFHPSQIKPNGHIPNVVFTDLKIMNEPVKIGEKLNKSIVVADGVNLRYNDYLFSIEFAALDYTCSQKNRYAYKMEGAGDDWIQLNSKREITFSGLEPGRYVFKVKGCNNDGVWNEDGKALEILISPPFWKTWWAYTIYFMLAVVIVVSTYRYRVKQLRWRENELATLVKKRTEELGVANESLQVANSEIMDINDELKESMNELVLANDELRKAYELKSEFLSIASHDLKDPLQVILGYTDMLKGKLMKGGQSTKEVDSINRSVEKMVKLISKLLDSKAIEQGVLKLHKFKIDLWELADSVVRHNLVIAEKKRQQITLSPRRESMVVGDKMLLRQVIENLVSNAIKYSPPGKTIRVLVEMEEAAALVKVRDEGPGFTGEDKKNLFKKFQRLSAQPTGGESSTGLGLSICKRFVQLHNGGISLESEPGKGSTFVVTLPLK